KADSLTNSGDYNVPHLLKNHGKWCLQIAFYILKELSTCGTINYPMVARESHLHDVSYYNLIIRYNWFLANASYSEDACIRWVDDSCELIYTKHAEIGDGK